MSGDTDHLLITLAWGPHLYNLFNLLLHLSSQLPTSLLDITSQNHSASTIGTAITQRLSLSAGATSHPSDVRLPMSNAE